MLNSLPAFSPMLSIAFAMSMCLLPRGTVADELSAETEPSAQRMPNILMVMVDDLGWMDLRCQGNHRLT
ncbi:MAG: hypothetical protein ACR2NZ_17060, partial [Rubripirellula sp.]